MFLDAGGKTSDRAEALASYISPENEMPFNFDFSHPLLDCINRDEPYLETAEYLAAFILS